MKRTASNSPSPPAKKPSRASSTSTTSQIAEAAESQSSQPLQQCFVRARDAAATSESSQVTDHNESTEHPESAETVEPPESAQFSERRQPTQTIQHTATSTEATTGSQPLQLQAIQASARTQSIASTQASGFCQVVRNPNGQLLCRYILPPGSTTSQTGRTSGPAFVLPRTPVVRKVITIRRPATAQNITRAAQSDTQRSRARHASGPAAVEFQTGSSCTRRQVADHDREQVEQFGSPSDQSLIRLRQPTSRTSRTTVRLYRPQRRPRGRSLTRSVLTAEQPTYSSAQSGGTTSVLRRLPQIPTENLSRYRFIHLPPSSNAAFSNLTLPPRRQTISEYRREQRPREITDQPPTAEYVIRPRPINRYPQGFNQKFVGVRVVGDVRMLVNILEQLRPKQQSALRTTGVSVNTIKSVNAQHNAVNVCNSLHSEQQQSVVAKPDIPGSSQISFPSSQQQQSATDVKAEESNTTTSEDVVTPMSRNSNAPSNQTPVSVSQPHSIATASTSSQAQLPPFGLLPRDPPSPNAEPEDMLTFSMKTTADLSLPENSWIKNYQELLKLALIEADNRGPDYMMHSTMALARMLEILIEKIREGRTFDNDFLASLCEALSKFQVNSQEAITQAVGRKIKDESV